MSLQLGSFPMLLGDEEEAAEEEDDGETKTEEDASDVTDILGAPLSGRSLDEIESLLAAASRKHKATKRCPVSSCNGKHPMYLRLTPGGELVPSTVDGPGCKEWHSFD